MNARYGVVYLTTASTTVYVEADSEEEAREIADESFEAPSICAQCSGWGSEHNLDLGEFEADESSDGVWLA